MTTPPTLALGDRRVCVRCGVLPFGLGHLEALGGDFVQINVRCLDADLDGTPVRYVDGRADTWQTLATRLWRDPFCSSTR